MTGRWEERYEITDPLSGTNRPVVGLKVSFATAAVSGGLARLLPNTWNMNSKLREIPDSVEEFTGFQKGLDLVASGREIDAAQARRVGDAKKFVEDKNN